LTRGYLEKYSKDFGKREILMLQQEINRIAKEKGFQKIMREAFTWPSRSDGGY
jgi:hypothetical protein